MSLDLWVHSMKTLCDASWSATKVNQPEAKGAAISMSLSDMVSKDSDTTIIRENK